MNNYVGLYCHSIDGEDETVVDWFISISMLVLLLYRSVRLLRAMVGKDQ